MPITPRWHDDNNKILVYSFEKPDLTDWDKYHHAIDRGLTMIADQNSDAEVYIVLDNGNAKMPAGNPIPHLKRTFRVKPDNVPLVINIVTNRFAKTMVNMLTDVPGMEARRVVSSWDEVQAVIREYEAQQSATK